MLNQELIEIDVRRRITLNNITCAYCGTPLDVPGVEVTEDHVIGRRFVPKDTLDDQWNLIVRVCRSCNNRKSDLEDDISAISMHADAWNQHVLNDEDFIKNAARKAKGSVSRRTSKRIKNSPEELKFTIPFSPGIEGTFTMVGPPQADWERVHKLAWFHSVALFYWWSYNQDKKIGGFFPGQFFHLNFAARRDWGNALMRGFMDAVIDWRPLLTGISARGFLKFAIRQHPSAKCWSSALEWNQSFRVISLFGEQEAVQAIVDTLPTLKSTRIPQQEPGHFINYRREIALADEDDKLFLFED